jgi:hypothetical protein
MSYRSTIFGFQDDAHFHFGGLVNKQYVQFSASENPRVIHEKVHHAPRITAWDAISSHGLLGPNFFEETVLLCLTFLLQVCRYRLNGSCRMEPDHTQRMLF